MGAARSICATVVLSMMLLAACSDGSAPAGPQTSSGGSAQPSATTLESGSLVAPPRAAGLDLLMLRHTLAFETYDLTHKWVDQYFHKRTLSLVTAPTPLDDASTSCRRFDHAGKPQIVCAAHGDLPSIAGEVVTLPSNLVPDTEGGRRVALDLLCIWHFVPAPSPGSGPSGPASIAISPPRSIARRLMSS